MGASFTLKFDGWAPDLQNVALEVDGSSAAVPCADCLNVYYQDAAFRCLPSPNPLGPALGTQALTLFSGYDYINTNNYVYAGTQDGISIFQNGAWSSVPVEPSVTVALTGLGIGFSLGGRTTSSGVTLTGRSMRIAQGLVNTRGGLLLNSTITAGLSGNFAGYTQGSFGALSPASTFQGLAIQQITSSVNSGVVSIYGSLPSNYFTSFVVVGPSAPFLTSNAQFSLVGSGAALRSQWFWTTPGGFGITNGNKYTVRIIS